MGRAIARCLRAALPAAVLLFLAAGCGIVPGGTARRTVDARGYTGVSTGYGIDVSVLKEIHDIRQGKVKFRKDKEQYISELIKVLSGIGNVIDEIKVNE